MGSKNVITLSAGRLSVHIYDTRQSMGEGAADMVSEKINQLLDKQVVINIIFASAPSQNELLAALVQNNTIDWTRVNAFHMDEYIELPDNDPRTFASFLRAKIFDKVPFNTVNYLDGNAADIGAECRRYNKLLVEHQPDIICMGIGENGHIAFNDPHVADFNDAAMVKMVKLDAECRQQQVNDNCFNQLIEVPAYALTLTIPALMAGKYIYCIVPGEKKAKAVYNTLNAEITEKYPSSILREHPNAMLFLDKDSSISVVDV